MRHLPFIEVTVDGNPVSDVFYNSLISATITDNSGNEADTFEAEFDDKDNAIQLPPKGAKIEVKFGYRDAISAMMGLFVIEKISMGGGTGGEVISISGKSADMRSDIKEQASEHFDNKSIGEVVDSLAKRHGFSSKVAEELCSMRLDYIVRKNQSTTDFLTRLADRTGATFIVKNGTFMFLKRGVMKSMDIYKKDCSDWNFEIEPRTNYGKIEAEYFDRKKGKRVRLNYKTELDGPVRRLRNTYSTETEALAAAQSEGGRLARATGSGSLSMAGMPELMADQTLNLINFRPEVRGFWRAKTVTHTYSGSYTTTVELEAPDKGKEMKKEE